MVLSINNLSKSYGKKVALDGISLEIQQGMFGLLGPNGAGKTTLMKILTTLLTQDKGEVEIEGIDISNKQKIRAITGYLPQEFSFYPFFTVKETVDYLGILSGITDKKEREEKVEQVLESVNLHNFKKVKVKALSGGMKRRLGIAQAVIASPKVLVIDEPTAGLDPEERMNLRKYLRSLSDEMVVILSTHIVEDIEATCERLAILDEGQLLFHGQVVELVQKAQGKVWEATVEQDIYDVFSKEFQVVSAVREGEGLKTRFVGNEESIKRTQSNLLNNSIDKIQSVAPRIEDAYMVLMKGGEINVF